MAEGLEVEEQRGHDGQAEETADPAELVSDLFDRSSVSVLAGLAKVAELNRCGGQKPPNDLLDEAGTSGRFEGTDASDEGRIQP